MAKQKKYKLRDSDRSGFTYKEIELVKDKGSLVGPDEFDTPPPSNKSLGGEELVPNPDARSGYDSYAQVIFRPTQYVTAGSGITFTQTPDSQSKTDTNNQWVYISGSGSNVTLSANPQISSGYQGALFTVQSVGSTVTLIDGNGLDLRNPTFNMTSGAILVLFYSATDNLWHEVNRSHLLGGI